MMVFGVRVVGQAILPIHPRTSPPPLPSKGIYMVIPELAPINCQNFRHLHSHPERHSPVPEKVALIIVPHRFTMRMMRMDAMGHTSILPKSALRKAISQTNPQIATSPPAHPNPDPAAADLCRARKRQRGAPANGPTTLSRPAIGPSSAAARVKRPGGGNSHGRP